jgi:DNA polymerase I-like protein with 3'-5' exonuclease and polymerase domains
MLVFSKVLILRFWSSAFIEDEEVVLILKDTMEEAGGGLLKIVPVEAEVVIASSWAEK